jgi:hypothetical protein
VRTDHKLSGHKSSSRRSSGDDVGNLPVENTRKTCRASREEFGTPSTIFQRDGRGLQFHLLGTLDRVVKLPAHVGLVRYPSPSSEGRQC